MSPFCWLTANRPCSAPSLLMERSRLGSLTPGCSMVAVAWVAIAALKFAAVAGSWAMALIRFLRVGMSSMMLFLDGLCCPIVSTFIVPLALSVRSLRNGVAAEPVQEQHHAGHA